MTRVQALTCLNNLHVLYLRLIPDITEPYSYASLSVTILFDTDCAGKQVCDMLEHKINRNKFQSCPISFNVMHVVDQRGILVCHRAVE